MTFAMTQNRGFVRSVFRAPNLPPSRFTIFIPHDYDNEREYPLILFLHGAGETGNDGVRPAQVGLGPAIQRQEKNFPFLVIFPQSHRGSWRAGSTDAQRALGILSAVERNYRVDSRRIHLTGISMGGYGTWSLAAEQPDRWASIIPVCGGGDPSDAPRIKHLACWCFHGEDDDVIPVEESRVMVASLRESGGDPKYTELPGVGHNSWDPAYASGDLYDWMLEQYRPAPVGLR